VPLPRLIRIVLAGLAAMGVAWLSLAAYLPRAFPERNWIADDRPARVFNAAGQELLANEGRLGAETFAELGAAMQRQPLASEPMFFYGMRALEGENLAEAERLLLEARARDPRSSYARLALMALYLRTGRVRQGSAELAVLARLEPRGNQLLVPQLVRLTGSAEARDALVEAVGDQPIMADVLTKLATDGGDPEIILNLARRQPARADGGFAEWQRLLLARLVEGGEERRAYDLWRRFVGGDARDLVYDPDFRGRPGPPPFNWELSVNDVGAAERGREGGLQIEFFGRKSGPLARQLLMLRPGRYRLAFEAEGSANGQGSRIELSLACRGGANLATFPFREVSTTRRRAEVDFTVPAGCEAQWVTFAGVAAEFPATQRLTVPRLSLTSSGGAS